MKRYEEPNFVVIVLERENDVITSSTGELKNQGAGGNSGYNWTDWF